MVWEVISSSYSTVCVPSELRGLVILQSDVPVAFVGVTDVKVFYSVTPPTPPVNTQVGKW